MNLIGLIIALLAIAFLLRLDFVYYIAYVCIGVYVIGRWYTPRAIKHVQINRRLNDHAFLGEVVDVRLHFRNLSRLPVPWLEYVESMPPELQSGEPEMRAIGLHGREERTFHYQIQAGRRGYYRLGPLRLSSGDLFGLMSSATSTLPPDFLTVYPRIIPLANLGLPSRLPFGTIASQQRLFEDPARPAGVRAYRSGDSQRQINWKASAHTNQLLVRRYQPAISLESVVLLNLHRDDYSRRDQSYYTEWAITVAASLAAHLAAIRQPVGLITNGLDPLQGGDNGVEPRFDDEDGRLLRTVGADAAEQLPPPLLPRTGRAHLMKLLEQLARIEGARTQPLADWAVSTCLPLSWGTTVLTITSRGDWATCQALHQLVRNGLNPILISVEPDAQFGETRQRARRLGFNAFHVLETQGLLLWRREQGRVQI